LHIESGGNQACIFASNRLREAIGASQLVLEAGTRFVLPALAAERIAPLPPTNLHD
jgi:hypothetical protein